ncbi:hypothetical protein [Bradyrhizobium jicamae]|nr:hypothetical protein [Bradyrhizobium jicamae]MBR0939072.1 hypothetical protein [Bradyrhizobium jicamae]
MAIIHALERDLSRPVLMANQVAFWHALRVSRKRITVTVTVYGSIFDSQR